MNMRWGNLMLDLQLRRAKLVASFRSFVSGLRWVASLRGHSKAEVEQARRITQPSTIAHAASGGMPWLLPMLFVLLIPTLALPKTSDTFSPLVLASPMNTQCHYTVDVRLMSLEVAERVAERMKCRLVVLGTFPDNPNWMILLGVPRPLHPLVRRDSTAPVTQQDSVKP